MRHDPARLAFLGAAARSDPRVAALLRAGFALHEVAALSELLVEGDGGAHVVVAPASALGEAAVATCRRLAARGVAVVVTTDGQPRASVPEGPRACASAVVTSTDPDDLVAVVELVLRGRDAEEAARGAQRAARRALDLLRGVTAGSDDLVAATDPDLRFLFFNDAYRREFARLWGWPLQVGDSLPEALAPWPEQQRSAEDLWRRAVAGESFGATAEFGPSPSERQVYELQFHPLHDADGVRIGACHTLRNVTGRVRTERALRESEERFRQLADAMPQLVWTASPDGSVDYYNERRSEYAGIEAGEGAYAWTPALHPDDLQPTVDAWSRAVATGEVYQMEHRVRMRDGGYRWHLSRGRPARDASGRVVRWFGTATDIHDTKLAQEELHRTARELASANEAKDQFLAMLAHELRNPLAALAGALHVVGRSPAPDERSARLRGLAERQVGALSRIVDDLLDVSRITRGKVELRREVLDLRRVARRVAENYESLRAEHGHELILELPGAPLPVFGDPTRLEQVVGNLVHNAIKYTPRGGRIVVRAGREGEQVVVAVQDNGVGIAPELLPRVFDLFTQADQTLARSQGGLGIGLTMVRGLVALHGGTVEARSGGSDGSGRGTEVVVRLPAVAAVAATKRVGSPATSPAPRDRRVGMRVLLVDDNRDALESMEELLGLWGFECRSVAYGAAAEEVAGAWRPDAVLVDIGLPDMDGYEVARRLRAQAGSAPLLLVAVTGYGQPKDRERSREAGFDHHLVKPVDLDALRRLLDAAPELGPVGAR